MSSNESGGYTYFPNESAEMKLSITDVYVQPMSHFLYFPSDLTSMRRYVPSLEPYVASGSLEPYRTDPSESVGNMSESLTR